MLASWSPRRFRGLVPGVAGKTTALDVGRDASETVRYTLIATSASGRPARSLGRAAGIGEPRAMAMARLMSWIDNGRLRPDNRTVLILDEPGMPTTRALSLPPASAAQQHRTAIAKCSRACR
jgi:hypothetical protein